MVEHDLAKVGVAGPSPVSRSSEEKGVRKETLLLLYQTCLCLSLPIIGESHVAAKPYEIVLQGNEVTMLHGRYRFALHWPELIMKTFTKIMSTPGDVENVMKSLYEAD